MTCFLNFLKSYIYWKGEKGKGDLLFREVSENKRKKDLFDNVVRYEL